MAIDADGSREDDRQVLDPAKASGRPEPLKEHQERSLKSLRTWWNGPRSDMHAGVLALPTGAGKTRTAVSFVLRDVLRSHRVLWLAHRDELLRSARFEFAKCAAESQRAFIVSRFDRFFKPGAAGDVVAASLPTLAHRVRSGAPNLERLLRSWRGNDAPLLVVVDECHHVVAPTWAAIIDLLSARLGALSVLGLSATPTRTDEREQRKLWRYLTRPIHTEPVRDLIREGILAEPRPECFTLDGVTVTAQPWDRLYWRMHHDFSPALTREIVLRPQFNAGVIGTWRADRGRWGRVLVFAANQEHARLLTRAFERQPSASGPPVRAGCVLSGAPVDERKQLLGQFRDGQLDVLVNVDICSEGTDIPMLDTVFIARPTRSRIAMQQMVGRAMRGPTVGGKGKCNIVLFSPAVVDLLDTVLYGTSMTSEVLGEWLGLAEAPALAVESPRVGTQRAEPAAEDLEGAPDPEQRVLEVIEALARLDPNEAPSQAQLPNDLLGWWEVVSRDRGAFIAVFRDDADALRAAVSRLSSRRPGFPVDGREKVEVLPNGVRWVTQARWTVFSGLLRSGPADVRFVPVDQATTDAWARVRTWITELPGGGKRTTCPHCGASELLQTDCSDYRKCERCALSHSYARKPKREQVPPLATKSLPPGPTPCPFCGAAAERQRVCSDCLICTCGRSHHHVKPRRAET